MAATFLWNTSNRYVSSVFRGPLSGDAAMRNRCIRSTASSLEVDFWCLTSIREPSFFLHKNSGIDQLLVLTTGVYFLTLFSAHLNVRMGDTKNSYITLFIELDNLAQQLAATADFNSNPILPTSKRECFQINLKILVDSKTIIYFFFQIERRELRGRRSYDLL